MKKLILSLLTTLSLFSLTSCNFVDRNKPIEPNQENLQFVIDKAKEELLKGDYVITSTQQITIKKNTYYEDSEHSGKCDIYKYIIVVLDLKTEKHTILNYYLIQDIETDWKKAYLDNDLSGNIEEELEGLQNEEEK